VIYIVSALFPLSLFVIGNIFLRWRFGVVLIFIWLFVGDAVRKIIPGQPPEIILIGDILLFFTYVSFFVSHIIKGKAIWTPPFLGSFLLFLFFVIAGFFNSLLPSLATGLIGFRSYIWFAPLLFLGYSFFKNKEQFLRFCRILVMLAVPIFLFAFAGSVLENSAPPIVKPFETAHQFHTFGIEDVVDKIPSIFGTDQRYGMVTLFLFLLGLGLLASGTNSKTSKKRIIFATLCALAGAIISGSRSAFVLAVLGFFLFVVISRRHFLKRQGIVLLRFMKLKRAFVLFIFLLLFLLLLYLVGGNSLGLFQIYALLNVFNSRVLIFAQEMRSASPLISFFGHGTGTFAQGLGEIGQFGRLNERIIAGGETGVMRLFFELGIVGFFVFYGFWIKIFIHIKNSLKEINNSDLKYTALSFSIFIFLVLLRFTFVHHQVLGDSAVLVLIWFFLGILFKMKSLEKG